MTLQLGIIGTNWITKMFVEAAHITGDYQLKAVYSRRMESGQTFADNFSGDIEVYTDVNDMLTSGIDVVYIASPNSLHFIQAAIAIRNGVHVIVEKSAVANTNEFEQLYSLLREHPQVRFFEAARHIQQDNFKALETCVNSMEHISGATFVYEKYSSRFDAYLAGEEPNVLSPKFAAGALADLGVYPLYAAIKLFGLPNSQHYFATKLRNGGDGRGVAILRYQDFDVTLIFGKGANSYLHSEVLGLRDTILISNIAELEEIKYNDGQGQEKVISKPGPANPMVDEAATFARLINQPSETEAEYQDLLLLSQRVNHVLTALRLDAGIVFPNDKK